MLTAKTLLDQVAAHLITVETQRVRILVLEAAILVAIEKLEAFDEHPESETLVDEAMFALNQSIGRM